MQLLIITTLFITFTLLTYGCLLYWDNRRKIQQRVEISQAGPAVPAFLKGPKDRHNKKRYLDLLSISGQWALKDQKEISKIRASLINAGYRHPNAPAIYYGLRILASLLFPIPFLVFYVLQGKLTSTNLLIAFGLAMLGFYLPAFMLQREIRKRQNHLDKSLPDVLDLIIICMEAGLSLSATLSRVAEEIRGVYRDFYTELHITTVELRTGIAWNEALNNLSQRTGVPSVKSLVALLIQSDRMGASIAQALRTHADFVRAQRALKAEEKAAKLALKLLFPLLLFIFPAMFIVILGPAAIHIKDMFSSGIK